MTRVTDQNTFRRRRFIAGALGLGAMGAFSGLRYGDGVSVAEETQPQQVASADSGMLVSKESGERLTTKYAATHYNKPMSLAGTRLTRTRSQGHSS